MYAESAGSRKTIGDVDVLYHDGIYHLFHLVLPNHDFIAHAVSSDCFNWRRVENALFIGHPGAWDDSMLWTMHVTPDPHLPGRWRMFYTGLSRRDSGMKQRVGMAFSDDLYTWHKSPVAWVDRRSRLPYELPDRPTQPPFQYDPDACFPLAPPAEHYENGIDEGRHWISWRDPFYYRDTDNDRGFLLVAGRVKDGPIVRRGCVAVMEETRPNHFEARPPLHHPGLYDDVEVPCLIKCDDEYYLIGSIREDAKVRYWHTKSIGEPWQSYHDNVLLATGNYAGRTTVDDKGILLWNFYTPDARDRTNQNLMPPPKRLVRHPDGLLRATTFEGFDRRVQRRADTSHLCPLKNVRSGDGCVAGGDALKVESYSGFQAYVFEQEIRCFRLSMKMCQEGCGKTGFVFRIDRQSHDGYYLSMDLRKGVAQLRRWGTGPDGSGENMMQFETLQSGFWEAHRDRPIDATLIAYGSYIELSVDGRVILTLVDQTFVEGSVGVYVESADLKLTDVNLELLQSPIQSDDHLTRG